MEGSRHRDFRRFVILLFRQRLGLGAVLGGLAPTLDVRAALEQAVGRRAGPRVVP
jgi:hypothetical protein